MTPTGIKQDVVGKELDPRKQRIRLNPRATDPHGRYDGHQPMGCAHVKVIWGIVSRGGSPSVLRICSPLLVLRQSKRSELQGAGMMKIEAGSFADVPGQRFPAQRPQAATA